MKIAKKILLAIVVILIAAIGYNFYDRPDRLHRVTPEALAALESDSAVTVTAGEYFVFEPADSSPTAGLIFYPGGECDERGYAEPLRAIADQGYLVVLVPMPLQMAFLGIDKADDVMAAYPDIETWVLAGHSLGGSMAARYAFNNSAKLDGLMLWDAYAPDDLTDSGLRVRMIHRADASGDTPDMYVPYLPLLPEDTEFVPLTGGSHLNFGRFVPGRMYRDEPPGELPNDLQLELVALSSIEFLKSVAGGSQAD
jgi:hypothetical protein